MQNFLFVIFFIVVLFLNPDIFCSAIEFEINTKNVSIYEPVEIDIKDTFKTKNNYDYSIINIKAYFKNGKDVFKEVDGFYMKDFEMSESGEVIPLETGKFKIRFTPDKPGKWKYKIKVFSEKILFAETKWNFFYCKKDEQKNGFIRISKKDDLFMVFDNKKPFYAIGLNLCWSIGDVIKDYEKWLTQLKENGGNFIRLWMANWFVGIEWIETGVGNYESRQKQAFLLDKIIDMCKERDIYVMLCLIPHGEFSTTTDSNWENNPYNLKNDGLLKEPSEFFTDIVARQAFKNRLKYIIARWGYSPNIFSWEIFNEADNTDNYNTENIAKWHADIISYIKQLDINRHLISTSFANPNMDYTIWKLKDINFTQTHFYGVKDGFELYELSNGKIDKFSKPHIISEFGMDTNADFVKNNIDPEGIGLVNSVWAGAFSMSFGAPMPWGWDDYIAKNNLFKIFKPLSEFISDIKFQDEDLVELVQKKVYFKNIENKKPGSIIFYTKNAWEKPKKNRFIINAQGEMIDASLFNGFIYGDVHEDMKNPPVFIMKNIRPGKFILKINKVSASNTLVVNLNGKDELIKELNAENYTDKKFFPEWNIYQSDVSEEFSIDLPAGDNEVKIDNHKGDWFTIEYIKITDFSDPGIAPVFVAGMQGPNSAYIWIKHKDYSWKNKSPEEMKNTYIDIVNLNEGRYLFIIINPETGEKILQGERLTVNGVAKLDLPVFNKSLVIKIKNLTVIKTKNEKYNN